MYAALAMVSVGKAMTMLSPTGPDQGTGAGPGQITSEAAQNAHS